MSRPHGVIAGDDEGVTAGITLAARGIFQWGLRQYESGNLAAVRG